MAASRVSVSWCGLCLLLAAVLCTVHHAGALEIYGPDELFVVNGTQAQIPCTFKSTDATSNSTTVTWTYTEEGSTTGSVIFHYISRKPYPTSQGRFKDRVSWSGDINYKDVSIKIDKITFKDNGTFGCSVINPPDVFSTPKQIKLRVVEKDNLPATNVPFLVGIICAAIGGLLVIAIIVFAVVITKKKRSRKNYTGSGDGGQTESLMSPVKQPPRRSPSDTEALVTGAPSGTVQGPVIYAQLDHSGKGGSLINKSETVVYADIRKNC